MTRSRESTDEKYNYGPPKKKRKTKRKYQKHKRKFKPEKRRSTSAYFKEEDTMQRLVTRKPFFYMKFPRYAEVQYYLMFLEQHYPRRVMIKCIGSSVQRQPIYMAVLSNNAKSTIRRDIVLIDAAMHAKEWLTLTTLLYIMHNLVKTDKLLEKMDFFLIPCINPDGYEYTHTRDRTWIKNRSNNGLCSPEDFGVDLNRNFPYCFGGQGSSDSPKDPHYKGRYPLSEPEARALAKVLFDYRLYIKLYISLHSCGSKILMPWSYTKRKPYDYADLYECARCAKEAIEECSDRKITIMNTGADPHLMSSGNSKDYAKGTNMIKFSYTIELPCSGTDNSTRNIVPIGVETFKMVGAMASHVYKYYILRKLNTNLGNFKDMEESRPYHKGAKLY